MVPSVAIREGVLKTFRMTRDHFRRLFDNAPYRFYVYDSANLSQVRQFAKSDSRRVHGHDDRLVQQGGWRNVIRQSTDQLQGDTPLHLVQAARPILILDEPQNMESEKSRAALALLDPLLALRYSATHRNPYNIVYRLTPFDAYRQGLVKKIEVDSVVREHDEAQPYVRVDDIRVEKTRISAKLTVHALGANGVVREKAVAVKPADSLEAKTGRAEYSEFVIDEINPGWGTVVFRNGIELKKGEESGADKEALFDAQIRHTIEEHFRKQQRLGPQGIKVLSLFFIDRVDNYVDGGVIRRSFDAAFDELKARHPEWAAVQAADVQAAYFAQKRRRGGAVELVDSVSGDAREDQTAYDLIMRDKEALLAFPSADDDEDVRRRKQVCFIFSHSALREGWDNPNVFQICTLNQTSSQVKKRQEIGRGVRLAVDQSGERVQDDAVNVLTVIANESYKAYVETLQSEIASEYRGEIEARYGKSIADLTDEERRRIEDEFGEGILPPKPRQAGQRRAHLRKARALSPEFKELWERIKHKTRYAVTIDTETLLRDAVAAMDRERVGAPKISVTKARVTVGDNGAFTAFQTSAALTLRELVGRYPLPNVVELIMHLLESSNPPVRLTRATLLEFVRRVDPVTTKLIDNPHEFAGVASRVLREALGAQIVDGIRYEKTGEWYEMSRLLAEEEVELFSSYVGESIEERALYDLMPCDSEVELRFVRDMEEREDVRLYFKLPMWFSVDTPVGQYRPDWAVVMERREGDEAPLVYLVAETKGSAREAALRGDEARKIACGRAHFCGALDGVGYEVVPSAAELR